MNKKSSEDKPPTTAQIKNPMGKSDSYWIFFAANAKPTSMRRAVAERLAEEEAVAIIEQPVSVLRERRVPTLERRFEYIRDSKTCLCYRPLHYPQRFGGFGKIIKRINEARLRRELDALLPRKGKRIICYDSPNQNHLVGELGEDVSVYLAIDDRTVTVEGDVIPGEIEAERDLLGKVDKVICVSKVLADVLRSRMPSGRDLPIHVLPNGYDERLFDPARKYTEPLILSDIPRPRVLVTGHVSERIDWDGVAGAVNARPDWTWVFVGPADPEMPKKIAQVSNPMARGGNGERRPRIVWHDAIPLKEVPSMIGHCDACAVPYRLNAFTRASNPLKAIEYLAMGRPVLSTRVPSLERYRNAIEWVDEADGDSYARALDKLLRQGQNREIWGSRRLAVTDDSWKVRSEQFKSIVLDRQNSSRRDLVATGPALPGA